MQNRSRSCRLSAKKFRGLSSGQFLSKLTVVESKSLTLCEWMIRVGGKVVVTQDEARLIKRVDGRVLLLKVSK